jgi:hypothetical protein
VLCDICRCCFSCCTLFEDMLFSHVQAPALSRACGRPRACAKRINQGALSAGRGHCKDMGCWLVTGGLGRRVQAGGTKSSAARSRWTAARAGGWRTSSALRPPMRMANTGHGCFTRCPSRWVRRRPPWQALGADTGPASLTQLSALLCMQDCVSARGSPGTPPAGPGRSALRAGPLCAAADGLVGESGQRHLLH